MLKVNRKIFIIAVIVLCLDHIVKSIISAILKVGESINIIPNFFSLTYIQNQGAAWGIFSNKPVIIIITTAIAALIIYKFMYSFKTNFRNNLAFGLVIGGLLGNLIDRLIFGYVRDFFDFQIFNYNYPVFIFFDIAIVIGVFLLIYAIIKGEDKHANNSKRQQ